MINDCSPFCLGFTIPIRIPFIRATLSYTDQLPNPLLVWNVHVGQSCPMEVVVVVGGGCASGAVRNNAISGKFMVEREIIKNEFPIHRL